MKLNNIKHIFFDLDHTLWDFDKNSALAFKAVFEKNRINVEVENFLKVYSPINANYWKLYRENKVTQIDLRYGRLKESFELLKILVSDEDINLLSMDYIKHLPQNNHLLEGAVELLEYLKPKYKLHIITNGFKEVQHKKLENSGILSFFESITTSEDVGVKKPHRLIFEKAIEKAKASCETSVMIGDNLEADIIGARKFGMKGILYNYYREEYSSEIVQVIKMREITAFL